jgi:hypothetical protein
VTKHVHRVKRITIGKSYLVYKCMDDCPSYYTPENMLGRTILCWACREEMKFSERNLRQTKPRCLNTKCILAKSPAAKAKLENKKKQGDVADNILKRLSGFTIVDENKEKEDSAAQLLTGLGISEEEARERLAKLKPTE